MYFKLRFGEFVYLTEYFTSWNVKIKFCFLEIQVPKHNLGYLMPAQQIGWNFVTEINFDEIHYKKLKVFRHFFFFPFMKYLTIHSYKNTQILFSKQKKKQKKHKFLNVASSFDQLELDVLICDDDRLTVDQSLIIMKLILIKSWFFQIETDSFFFLRNRNR